MFLQRAARMLCDFDVEVEEMRQRQSKIVVIVEGGSGQDWG